MTFKWAINIDITFRIIVGVCLMLFGCWMAYNTLEPEPWFGLVALGAFMVLAGSKALSHIKTPYFTIGNGCETSSQMTYKGSIESQEASK